MHSHIPAKLQCHSVQSGSAFFFFRMLQNAYVNFQGANYLSYPTLLAKLTALRAFS